MGTRSVITFVEKYNDKETPLVSVYQQFDGYLTGVGTELCEWLLKKKIVNGLGLGDEKLSEIANGFGCLTAQFIRDFKTRPGYLYIYPLDHDSQDFNYKVIFNMNKYFEDDFLLNELLTIEVDNFGEKPFFTGTPSELKAFIEKYGDNYDK